MATRRKCGAGLAALAVLAGCGGASDPGESSAGPQVRDSAGVRIVENRPADSRTRHAWRLADAPLLDLGGLEGPAATQFFQVGDGTLLPDGGFVLAGFGSHDLRRFGADGRHIWTAGREGDGPGEFEGVTSVAAGPGDTLFSYDFRQRRISRWAPDGSFLGSRQLEGVEGAGFPFVEALLADGRAVYTWRTFGLDGPPPEGEVRRDTLEVRVAIPGESEAKRIGRFPGPEMLIMRQSQTSQGVRLISGAPPFARGTHVAATPTAIWVGDGAEPVVRRFGYDGSLEVIVHLPLAPRPVDEAMIREGLAAQLEEAEDEEDRDLARQRWEELPRPDALPFFEALATDAEDNLWVRTFQAPGEETRTWHVLSADGTWLGSLVMPDRYGPLAIGGNVVLARYADELDVEHVQLREIVRPG